jgi:hypothetical protein
MIYWAEVVNTACYIGNQIFSSGFLEKDVLGAHAWAST